MSKKIFFYSRTGTCAQVADRYSKNEAGYKVQVMDIPENRYWGTFGYLKAGFNTLFNKGYSYSLVGDKYTSSEEVTEIILIMPVWAGKMPPTFREFLLNESFKPGLSVQVVTVSRSGQGREVFHQIVEILQKTGVTEIRHKNLKSSEVI